MGHHEPETCCVGLFFFFELRYRDHYFTPFFRETRRDLGTGVPSEACGKCGQMKSRITFTDYVHYSPGHID